jgi:hypothetical protein
MLNKIAELCADRATDEQLVLQQVAQAGVPERQTIGSREPKGQKRLTNQPAAFPSGISDLECRARRHAVLYFEPSALQHRLL